MKRRWGIFRKMLMSYLVITLIPFVLLSVSVIEVTNQSYAKSLLQRSEMELDRAQTVLDVRLTEMLTMAYQLSENTVLFTDDLTQYTRYESVEKIRQMRVGNQFVKNIALWHTAKQEVYTSSGVMSKATYVEKVLKLPQEACDLQKQIQNGGNYFFLNVGEGHIVYAVPCRLARNNAVMALFLIDVRDVFGLLSQVDPGLSEYGILMANGETVLRHMLPHEVDAQQLLHQEQVEVNGENYRILRPDTTSRLHLMVLVHEDGLSIPLDKISLTLLLTVVLLVGCVGLSTWLASVHFKPVFQLGQMLTKADKTYDNWEELHRDVYDTIRQNEEYIETIVEQKRQLQEHNLIRLLYGEVSADKLMDAASEMNLNAQICCCTACIRVGGTPRSAEWMQAVKLLEQRRGENETLLEMERENVIAVVFLYEKAVDAASVTRRCQTLLAGIQPSELVHAGVGGVENSLSGLRNSFLQALAALEFADRQEPITVFSEMLVAQEPVPNLKEQELYINLALKQGDEQLARENILSLMRWSSNAPRARSHYVCYSLLEMIVPVVAEAFGEEKAEMLRQNLTAEINAGHLEDFRRAAEKAAAEICAKRNEQSQQNHDELKMEVLACVHEKYTDSDMSLEYLAERFGFSNFYWSRYFKDVIGQNFNDYVWTLRLERAKQLLSTTMPLAEVVENVGYIDVRSFTRRFKNATGMTPAQYKKEQEAAKSLRSDEGDNHGTVSDL